jgi:hypothetical protein
MHPNKQHNTWSMDHTSVNASKGKRIEETQNMHTEDDVDKTLACVLQVRLLLPCFDSRGYSHGCWVMFRLSVCLSQANCFEEDVICLVQVYNSRATPYAQVPRGALDVRIRPETAETAGCVPLHEEKHQVKQQDLIVVGPQRRLVQVRICSSNVCSMIARVSWNMAYAYEPCQARPQSLASDERSTEPRLR